jgi:nucleotide-binding universal stress UspA family protein
VTAGLAAVLGLAAGAGLTLLFEWWRRRRIRNATRASRIVFPFLGDTLSLPALDAAIRLARAERATLVPVYLATVPRTMPLDSPLPHEAEQAVPMLETIEQRAVHSGVPVDARIERGRSLRHALRQLIDHNRYGRMVVPAAGHGSDGLTSDDIGWLLETAPGEVVVLRSGDLHEILTPDAEILTRR